MGRPAIQDTDEGLRTGRATSPALPSTAAQAEYPVRDYIAGMSVELAQMARWDGDEMLAGLLDAVVLRAEGARP